MTDKKSLADLTDELVNVMYELDKAKYSRPERIHGWIKTSYLLAFGLDNNLGKRQLANTLQRQIDEARQELSDLCAKVEV